MLAIGFFLLAFGIVTALVSDYANPYATKLAWWDWLAGNAVVGGGILLVAGIVTLLWRVAP